MPKISVILCAYNAADTIEAAVRSVLDQSLKDLELIVVNDGSRDSTKVKLEELLKTDERIRLINIENGGPANARNTGVEEATGEFITFCDADDTVEAKCYEDMYSMAVRDGSDCVICGYFRDTVVEGSVTDSTKVFVPDGVFKTKEELFSRFIEMKSTFILDSTCNKLFKRSTVVENGIKMPIGELFEDSSFVLKFLSVTQKVSLSSNCYYHYFRRSGGSSITKSYDQRKLRDLKRLYGELQRFCDFSEQNIKNYCAMFYVRTVFSCLSELYFKGACDKKQRKRIIDGALSEEIFKTSLEAAKPYGMSDRVTLVVAKLNARPIIRLYCRLVWLMKNKAHRLFAKLK